MSNTGHYSLIARPDIELAEMSNRMGQNSLWLRQAQPPAWIISTFEPIRETQNP